MKISVLCSSSSHPVYKYLESWCTKQQEFHNVELVSRVDELSGGDVLFLISCVEFITAEVRNRYNHSLVIHASDLPEGRGWSPLVWQIIEGKNSIVVSLIEAADSIDCGSIWHKASLTFEGHELVDEINARLFECELGLMDYAVENYDKVVPQPQLENGATYYERRVPENSRIDPEKSLASQFELLRVSDPERYPAFFEYRGYEYEISLRKRKKVK